MTISYGLSIHCHRDTLFEWCENYQERVDYIKSMEIDINQKNAWLQVFKMLSKRAIEELPKELVVAELEGIIISAKCRKLEDKLKKAKDEYFSKPNGKEEWLKISEEFRNSNSDWNNVNGKWRKANSEWGVEGRKLWHDKFCGCSFWNGDIWVLPR